MIAPLAVQTDAFAEAVPSYRAGTAAGYRPSSETSKEAADKTNAKLLRSRARVLAAVIGSRDGVTCRELCTRWGVGMNEISGRFTELHTDGHIRREGKRGGCSVWFGR